MYDPETARFLTPDPIYEAGGHPNLYLYCANDPVNHTDPSGSQSADLPFWGDRIPWWHPPDGPRVPNISGLLPSVTEFPGLLLEAQAAAIESALASLLDLVGIDYQALKAGLRACKNTALALPDRDDIRNFDLNLFKSIGRVGDALGDAVNQFAGEWDKEFPAAAETWLGVPSGFFNLNASPDVGSLFAYVLKQGGLTWDSLLDRIQTALGADPLTLVTLYEKLTEEKLLDSADPATALEHIRTKGLDNVKLPGLDDAIGQALKAAREAVARSLGDALPKQIREKIWGYIGQKAAFGGWIRLILKAMQFSANNLGGLCDFLQAMVKSLWKAMRKDVKMEDVSALMVDGFRRGLPLLIAFGAHELRLNAAEVLKSSLDKAGKTLLAPLDVVVRTLGTYIKGGVDATLQRLGLGDEQPRPLTKVAQKTDPVWGHVKLWVGSTDNQPRFKASPTEFVLAYLSGKDTRPSGVVATAEQKKCLEDIKKREYADLGVSVDRFVFALGVQNTAKPRTKGPKTVVERGKPVHADEQKLLDALIKANTGCEGLFDPCDLAGLTKTVREDADSAATGEYTHSARFTYLSPRDIYDPLNRIITYYPPSSVTALVEPFTDPNDQKYNARNYERWVLVSPCRIHTELFKTFKFRQGGAGFTSGGEKIPQASRPSGCKHAQTGEVEQEIVWTNERQKQNIAVFWDEKAGCDVCTYFAHPIIGWCGTQNYINAVTIAPNTEVRSAHCRLASESNNHDQIGHLIAARFGGYARLARGGGAGDKVEPIPHPNLFPQNGAINQGGTPAKGLRGFEAVLATQLYPNLPPTAAPPGPKRRLCIRIVLDYTSSWSPSRPKSLRYYVWLNRRQPSKEELGKLTGSWPAVYENPPT